jgi:hypothetical protein
MTLAIYNAVTLKSDFTYDTFTDNIPKISESEFNSNAISSREVILWNVSNIFLRN